MGGLRWVWEIGGENEGKETQRTTSRPAEETFNPIGEKVKKSTRKRSKSLFVIRLRGGKTLKKKFHLSDFRPRRPQASTFHRQFYKDERRRGINS